MGLKDANIQAKGPWSLLSELVLYYLVSMVTADRHGNTPEGAVQVTAGKKLSFGFYPRNWAISNLNHLFFAF